MYYVIYSTGESLGYYNVLVLFRELFNYLTVCSQMQYVIRFTINEDLINSLLVAQILYRSSKSGSLAFKDLES